MEQGGANSVEWDEDTTAHRIGAAIIGAQKCGTTTLAAMLDAHPDVRLALGKEAHLFDDADVQQHGIRQEHIETFWPNPRPGELLLDATPSYLFLPGCIEALLAHSPEVRCLVMLRPPGERMVSHHGHERRMGTEKRGFLGSVLLERGRLRRSVEPLASDSAHRRFSYRARSRYSEQLSRLASLTDNYHVILLADLITDPVRVMDEIHRFLGLSPLRVAEAPRLNAGDGPPRRVATAIARRMMYREAVTTESFLGRRAGTLR